MKQKEHTLSERKNASLAINISEINIITFERKNDNRDACTCLIEIDRGYKLISNDKKKEFENHFSSTEPSRQSRSPIWRKGAREKDARRLGTQASRRRSTGVPRFRIRRRLPPSILACRESSVVSSIPSLTSREEAAGEHEIPKEIVPRRSPDRPRPIEP